MSLIIQTILCILFITYSQGYKPIFIIQIFRHGAREVHFSDLLNVKYKYQGEITSIGLRSQYTLGQHLKQTYPYLFGEQYNSSKIYIQSTDKNRTIMSAQAQLYSIYPLGTGPKLPINLNKNMIMPPFSIQDSTIQFDREQALPELFQPVPIYVTPKPYEYILRSFDPIVCPKQEIYVQEQLASKSYQLIENEFLKTREKLSEIHFENSNNKRTLNLFECFKLIDNYISYYHQGIDIPIEFGSDFWKELELLWDISFSFVRYSGVKQRKIVKTPLLNKLVELLVLKQQNQLSYDVILFSAHDSTLFNFLIGLKIITWQCLLQKYKQQNYNDFSGKCPRGPRYSSNVIIELYQPTDLINEYHVRIIYDGHELFLCGNQNMQRPCSLEEFKLIALKDNVDYFKECGIQKYIGNTNNSQQQNQKDNSYSFLDYFMFFLLIGAAGLLTFMVTQTYQKYVLSKQVLRKAGLEEQFIA